MGDPPSCERAFVALPFGTSSESVYPRVVQARSLFALLVTSGACAESATPVLPAPIRIEVPIVVASAEPASTEPAAPTPPSSPFVPISVGPSALVLHGLEDGVVALGRETTDPDRPTKLPIGLVRGASADFAEGHWLLAGSTEVTAVGGRLAGPLFLSKRFDAGPPLPQTLTLGAAGWKAVNGGAAKLAVDEVFASGKAWAGTIYDPWGQASGFVALEGTPERREWLRVTCSERIDPPLRVAGLARSRDGALLVVGKDCTGRARRLFWRAGQSAPDDLPVDAAAPDEGATSFEDGFAVWSARALLLGAPERFRSIEAPKAEPPIGDVAVVGAKKLYVLQDHRVFGWDGAAFAPLSLPYDLPATSIAATDADLYVASGPVLFRLGAPSAPPTSDLERAMMRLLEVSPVAPSRRAARAQLPSSCATPVVWLAPLSPFLPPHYDFPASRERLAKPVKGVNEQLFGPYDVVVARRAEGGAPWLAVRAANPFTASSVARVEDFPELAFSCEPPKTLRQIALVPRLAD